MQSLLSAEKYDQLKDYLAETNDYIYSNNVIIDSGNETIDSVLNYKLAPLENNSVEKVIMLFFLSKFLSVHLI